jgi:uncharacterized protein YaeQ
MAIKATIFKVDLSISDLDKHYYADHQLTIARHPSENDQRMMLRVLAFAFNAHEQLSFTRGLSENDEPELWQKSYSDEIELWIELGQPSEQRIKKGCNQSRDMIIYGYDHNAFSLWFEKEKNVLNMRKNLHIATVPENIGEQLAELVTRQMQIQCTIQDGQAWFNIADQNIEVSLTHLKE